MTHSVSSSRTDCPWLTCHLSSTDSVMPSPTSGRRNCTAGAPSVPIVEHGFDPMPDALDAGQVEVLELVLREEHVERRDATDWRPQRVQRMLGHQRGELGAETECAASLVHNHA